MNANWPKTGNLARLAGIILVGAMACAGPVRAQNPGEGPGFVLLDFKTQANVNLGQWLKWVYPGAHPNNPNPPPGPQGSRRGAFGPVNFTYAVDASFMSNQSPETFAGAKAAVESALRTWSEASNGYLRFNEAPWPPVVNITNDPVNFPFPNFSGPAFSYWCGNYACPPCNNCASVTLFPGLGADIDVFSRPIGWQLVSNGFTYTMTSGILGFTSVHRASDGIWIVDIYLNRDFTWTTSTAQARTPAKPVRYTCDPLAPVTPILPGDDVTNELGATVYDIETVILHELGHALGFDHPNEACAKNAAVLDPYTRQFLACANSSPECVMHGAYNGVKRQLTDADIGGLAFLYKPRKAGDVDADDRLTISDAAYAMVLFQHPGQETPYEVSAVDFINHNGKIDIDEVVLLLYWVLDPINFSPGVVPDVSSMAPERAMTSLAVSFQAEPADIGLKKQFSLSLSLANPNQIAVTGWDFVVTYDAAVFSNPQISNGSLLPSGSWSIAGSSPGAVRFAKLGFPPGDQATNGVLGTITFDMNLAAAALTPEIVSLPIVQTNFAVVDPVNQMVRVYGSGPGDLLVVDTPQVMSYRYDVDGNECVDVEDAYAYVSAPIDVTKNGDVNDNDRHALSQGVRYGELSGITQRLP